MSTDSVLKPLWSKSPVAIIAAGGDSPFRVADALLQHGQPVVLFAITDWASSERVANYPHEWIHLLQFGRFCRLAKLHRCKKAMMVGALLRPSISRLRIDWLFLKSFPRIFRAFGEDDEKLLLVIRNLFEEQGFKIVEGQTIDDLIINSQKPLEAPLQADTSFSDRTAGRISDAEDTDTNPPPVAEFLVALFANSRRRDAILGDMEEKFIKNLSRGKKRAARLYWAEAIKSIGPQVWRRAKWIAAAAGALLYGKSWSG
jgi:hypothetical protein